MYMIMKCFCKSNLIAGKFPYIIGCCGEFPHLTYKLRPSLTSLEQQRTNLRLIMAESTTLNAASSPQLKEDGLTDDDRV